MIQNFADMGYLICFLSAAQDQIIQWLTAISFPDTSHLFCQFVMDPDTVSNIVATLQGIWAVIRLKLWFKNGVCLKIYFI